MLILVPFVSTAAPVLDPVAKCRAAHAGDTDAYVRCLEQALAARDCGPGETRDAAAEPPPAAAAGLGSEQVESSRDTETAVRIVSATYDARGLGTFRMSDGQVWRETSATPARYRLEPDREYTGRIVRGKIGGYRLHVEGVRRMMTVRRVE